MLKKHKPTLSAPPQSMSLPKTQPELPPNRYDFRQRNVPTSLTGASPNEVPEVQTQPQHHLPNVNSPTQTLSVQPGVECFKKTNHHPLAFNLSVIFKNVST